MPKLFKSRGDRSPPRSYSVQRAGRHERNSVMSLHPTSPLIAGAMPKRSAATSQLRRLAVSIFLTRAGDSCPLRTTTQRVWQAREYHLNNRRLGWHNLSVKGGENGSLKIDADQGESARVSRCHPLGQRRMPGRVSGSQAFNCGHARLYALA